MGNIIELNQQLSQTSTPQNCNASMSQSNDAIKNYIQQMQANNTASPEAEQNIVDSSQTFVNCIETTATAKKHKLRDTLFNKISDEVAKFSKDHNLMKGLE